MNLNEQAKSLTFWRGSEVSQVYTRKTYSNYEGPFLIEPQLKIPYSNPYRPL